MAKFKDHLTTVEVRGPTHRGELHQWSSKVLTWSATEIPCRSAWRSTSYREGKQVRASTNNALLGILETHEAYWLVASWFMITDRPDDDHMNLLQQYEPSAFTITWLGHAFADALWWMNSLRHLRLRVRSDHLDVLRQSWDHEDAVALANRLRPRRTSGAVRESANHLQLWTHL